MLEVIRVQNINLHFICAYVCQFFFVFYKKQQVKSRTYSAKRLLQTKQPYNYIQVDILISNFKKKGKTLHLQILNEKLAFKLFIFNLDMV